MKAAGFTQQFCALFQELDSSLVGPLIDAQSEPPVLQFVYPMGACVFAQP